MAKTLSFTNASPRTVKIGDTTTSFTLICGNNNMATDLTNATSITVKLGNVSGYLKSATVDPNSLTDSTANQVTVTFTADLMTSLPAGSYTIEVWVVDSTGTSIYPSDGSTGFTITNNIQSANGSTITTITFDDFVKAMNKAASTIAKGDPGEGLDIKGQVTSISALPTTANEGNGYLVNEELYVYTSGVWKDCGTIQGPQGIQGKTGTGISSTTIQYQISSSATTTPTGTWSNNIVATTTANPYLWMKATLNYTDNTTKDFYLVSQKGDKGDPGPTGTVDNAGLISAPAFQSLQAQVDNSAVGTNLLLDSQTQTRTPSWLTTNNSWTEDYGTYLGSNINYVTKAYTNARYSYKDLLDRGVINTTDDFTYSIYFRVVGEDPAGMSNATVRFYSSATTKDVTILPLTSLKEGQWTRLVISFKFKDFEYDPTNDYLYSIRMEVPAAPEVAGARYEYAAPKLEKGSVATDWCLNPSEILTQGDYAKIKAAIVALGGSLS